MSRSAKPTSLLVLTTVAALLTGCRGDPAKKVSSGKYLMALQNKTWTNARATLKTDRPVLTVLMAAGTMVCGRTRARLEKDYHEPNRAEVLAKLDEIGQAYLREVMPKLEADGNGVRLRPGVTLAQLRQAFDAVDVEYRKFEAMVQPQ